MHMLGKDITLLVVGAPTILFGMAKPVPVYLTYRTAVPSGTELAFYEDIYKKDAPVPAAEKGQPEPPGRASCRF